MKNIQIWVGTTWIKLPVSRQGCLPDGTDMRNFVTHELCEREWDAVRQHYILLRNHTAYDTNNNLLIMPRYALDKVVQCLEDIGYSVEFIEVEPYTPRQIDIRMKKSFEPRGNQQAMIDFLVSPDRSYKPMSANCGEGKALPDDTPIKIPGGWKRMGDIQVGDVVTAWDGTPTTVTGVFPQGPRDVFDVAFVDGRHILADRDHLWAVHTPDTYWHSVDGGPQGAIIMTTDQLFQRVKIPPQRGRGRDIRTYIPLVRSEQIADIDLPLDPYVLGVIIGDGSITNGRLMLATDRWIVDKVLSIVGPEKYTLRVDPPRRPDSPEYFVQVYFRYNGDDFENSIDGKLKALGLSGKRSWEKFIPDIYLEASHDQRLALIQGLMDTDGYISDPTTTRGRNGGVSKSGSPEFCTTSFMLARQFQRLIWSIGGMCTIREKTPVYTYRGERKIGRPAYIIRYRVRHLDETLTLPRKVERTAHENQYSQYLKLGVVRVEPIAGKMNCTCISVDHPDQLYVAGDYIVTHNTVVSIAACAQLGFPVLLVLGFLIDQWYKSLLQFTTLRKDDIYVVQGFDSLKDLWEMLNNGFEPKVVIFSTRTLAMYAIDRLDPYTTLPSYAEFQQKVGFGVLVHDETHLNFYTNTQIDIRSNIKHNIFLSATYQRSDYQGNRIFNMVFPRELLFGAQFVKKYTSVTVVGYRLGISQKVVPKFMVAKGYLHAKYENWLVAHHTFFESFMKNVLRVLINMYYTTKKKDGQKLLILCQTKKFVLEVVKYLKDMLTDKVTAYFSGDSKYGNSKLLNTAVIVSTIKSCSTGIDIKGLKTCINTVSFRSEPQAAQCMGRLRQIPGEETIYIDIWNKEIPSHYYHQKSRVNVYKTKALTFYQTDL